MLELYTADTLCVFANDPSGHPPGYGWDVKITPVKEVGDTLIVRVDWKRSRDQGQVTDAPRGSVELALAPGRSVPLDYIVPGPSGGAFGPCDAVGMLLQVDLRR